MRIGRQQIANALAIVGDVLPKISGLMLSKWIHAAIDCMQFAQMQIINGTVPDGTGTITLYTVPKGSIWQILNVECIATSGTWTASRIRIQLKAGAGYSSLRQQTAGAFICLAPIQASGAGCMPTDTLALHEGDSIAVVVDVDTAGAAGYSLLGRLMKA